MPRARHNRGAINLCRPRGTRTRIVCLPTGETVGFHHFAPEALGLVPEFVYQAEKQVPPLGLKSSVGMTRFKTEKIFPPTPIDSKFYVRRNRSALELVTEFELA